MHLFMEFELNDEEIAQVLSLQAEIEAELLRENPITVIGYKNDVISRLMEI